MINRNTRIQNSTLECIKCLLIHCFIKYKFSHFESIIIIIVTFGLVIDLITSHLKCFEPNSTWNAYTHYLTSI